MASAIRLREMGIHTPTSTHRRQLPAQRDHFSTPSYADSSCATPTFGLRWMTPSFPRAEFGANFALSEPPQVPELG